jgi:RNA polymerase sigma-32 factor
MARIDKQSKDNTLKSDDVELDNGGINSNGRNDMTSIALPILSQDAGLARYLDEIKKVPMLSEQEEKDLARKWHEEKDLESAQKLVTSHLRLVAKIAQQFKGYGLPMTDMISEGNVGLMIAVKKFNPNKGFRLATYAMWWIRATIQDYVLKSWSMVKIGTSSAQKKLFFNLKKIKSRLYNMNEGRLPANVNEVIADELNLSPNDVRDMDMRMSGGDIYLNSHTSNSDDDGGEVIDVIASPDESHEISILDNQEYDFRKRKFTKAFSTLNPREQEVIEARRLSEKPETLEVLGARYGVSSERIRQIEEKALEKLTKAVGNY